MVMKAMIMGMVMCMMILEIMMMVIMNDDGDHDDVDEQGRWSLE